MSRKQKTLKQEVVFKGIGVHSGQAAIVTVKPSKVDSGIIIKHKSFDKEFIKFGVVVPEKAMHATVLKKGSFFISTIEHLISAIIWLEIDNAIIETQSLEIPILDGSALPFVQGFLASGIVEQEGQVYFLTPQEKLQFAGDNGRFIEITPAHRNKSGLFDTSLFVQYLADFSHPLVGKSNLDVKINKDFFIEQIAPARTFGFLEQLPFLKQHGLAKGTSLGNTVVIGEDEFLNDQRFQDEFVRHKLLDLLGDFGLLGKRLAGTVFAKKTGHSFNCVVVEHYVKNPDLWKLIY